jgi:hypothetical protein
VLKSLILAKGFFSLGFFSQYCLVGGLAIIHKEWAKFGYDSKV